MRHMIVAAIVLGLVAMLAKPASAVAKNGIMTAQSSATGGTSQSRKAVACKSARERANLRHTMASTEFKQCVEANRRAQAAGQTPMLACKEVHLLSPNEELVFAGECSCYDYTATYTHSSETKAATHCAIVYGFREKVKVATPRPDFDCVSAPIGLVLDTVEASGVGESEQRLSCESAAGVDAAKARTDVADLAVLVDGPRWQLAGVVAVQGRRQCDVGGRRYGGWA